MLNADELFHLTGSRSPQVQARWLARHHVPFTFNGTQVRVERKVAEAHELFAEAEDGPNWEAVR